MNKKIVFLLCSFVILLFLNGCRGTVYTTQVEISSDPPPRHYEVAPRSPGANYFWVEGRWHWGGHRWVWRPGYYGYARRGYSEWVPGYWEKRGPRWVWRAGYWR